MKIPKPSAKAIARLEQIEEDHFVSAGTHRMIHAISIRNKVLGNENEVSFSPMTRHKILHSQQESGTLLIRLARVGDRKQPLYRIVVIEKARARNGRSVEIVGTYNPRTKPISIELKRDRIEYWKSKGAHLSGRVGKLVKMFEPSMDVTEAEHA